MPPQVEPGRSNAIPADGRPFFKHAHPAAVVTA